MKLVKVMAGVASELREEGMMASAKVRYFSKKIGGAGQLLTMRLTNKEFWACLCGCDWISSITIHVVAK